MLLSAIILARNPVVSHVFVCLCVCNGKSLLGKETFSLVNQAAIIPKELRRASDSIIHRCNNY